MNSARPDGGRRKNDRVFTEKLKSNLEVYTRKKERMLEKQKYMRSYEPNLDPG